VSEASEEEIMIEAKKRQILERAQDGTLRVEDIRGVRIPAESYEEILNAARRGGCSREVLACIVAAAADRGTYRWVHCHSHGAPHLVSPDWTCWCGCVPDGDPGPGGYKKEAYPTTLLEQTGNTREDHVAAAEECRRKGLWLYADRNYS